MIVVGKMNLVETTFLEKKLLAGDPPQLLALL